MKTIIGTLALGLLTTASVQAQNMNDRADNSSRVTVGPVISGGVSEITNMGGSDRLPTGGAGVNAIYSPDGNWGFGGVAAVSHEGYTKDIRTEGGLETNGYKAAYARVSPRVYYFIGNPDNIVRPLIYAGPSVAIKLTQENYFYEPEPVDDINRVYSNQSFTTGDFGGNAGIGLRIRMFPKTWLQLDGDYYHGIIDVTRIDPGNNQIRTLRGNLSVNFGI